MFSRDKKGCSLFSCKKQLTEIPKLCHQLQNVPLDSSTLRAELLPSKQADSDWRLPMVWGGCQGGVEAAPVCAQTLKHARNARHRKAGNVRLHLAMSHAMCRVGFVGAKTFIFGFKEISVFLLTIDGFDIAKRLNLLRWWPAGSWHLQTLDKWLNFSSLAFYSSVYDTGLYINWNYGNGITHQDMAGHVLH